ARKWCRRNPALTALIAVLALGLAISSSAAWLAWAQRNHAQAAEKTAGEQRDRAVTAEERTRGLLRKSYADAAQGNLQRGLYRDGLTNLDLALEAGHPDEIGLRLDKVRCWVGLNEVAPARRELDDLARLPLQGRQRARFLVLRGDLRLGVVDDEGGL